jgi:endo-1,4-beta-xylanase
MKIKLTAVAVFLTWAAYAAPQDSQTNGVTLKEAYKDDFLIGVSINQAQFQGQDQRGIPIIQAQFNSISPENILKWESVHPQPGHFNFAGPDRYVAFGETNGMFIIGHTLVWHNQTPRWVFQDDTGRPVSREVLLQRMREHILTVVGRYRGRIKGWDVVNEALNDDGSLRASPWRQIIGDDYIEKAFQYAHEADPQAQLHYNDYALENEPKRRGAIALVKRLKAEGIPITAVGLQCHVQMDWPTVAQEDATISAFAGLGVKVMITELDVDIAPNSQPAPGTTRLNDGLSEAQQQALAQRYAELFRVFLKHRADISRVTFWDVTDGDSWLNAPGRANYPLLFDRAGKPKPAFAQVIKQAGLP